MSREQVDAELWATQTFQIFWSDHEGVIWNSIQDENKTCTFSQNLQEPQSVILNRTFVDLLIQSYSFMDMFWCDGLSFLRLEHSMYAFMILTIIEVLFF